jgi:hypothetical protein
MWIVKLAPSRPDTFAVLALVLSLISPVMLLRTPIDIFPDINIPVISGQRMVSTVVLVKALGGGWLGVATPPTVSSP